MRVDLENRCQSLREELQFKQQVRSRVSVVRCVGLAGSGKRKLSEGMFGKTAEFKFIHPLSVTPSSHLIYVTISHFQHLFHPRTR